MLRVVAERVTLWPALVAEPASALPTFPEPMIAIFIATLPVWS